jgi:hypothetical protein
MQALAASCKYLGQISHIEDGIVERKQPRGQWQKITRNTRLCDGDILRTTSDRAKKITVKVKCTTPVNPETRVAANQIAGVRNVCSVYDPGRGTRQDGGAR